MKKSLLSLSLLLAGPALAASPSVTVYKSPTCGCCESWVEHMRESGFEVNSIDTELMGALKQKAGVEPRLASCHTAHVDGYVIEGHVPAADVKRLLQQQPEVRGLSIPGMPQSAPGMDIPGTPYEVLGFDEQGNTAVFSRYPG
ncbi:DUF411 domain-containing protein [Oceanimonas baumannii]|uniref:Metal-binding protein n=1 Tax=Oceanimonas baumannii TaxID=129578 RepID=A0A235CHX9_9GAMM|nr:DUF411 domain-containing protein [Oceanimonas baumannii]OYD23637.1 metal-binding protein [Oceanimonas baumannii]TDW55829.1 hypothetical protein LY04_03156 [Oceanimonas baumannii]